MQHRDELTKGLIYQCAEGIVHNVRQWEQEWIEEDEPAEDAQQGVHNRILKLEEGLEKCKLV